MFRALVGIIIATDSLSPCIGTTRSAVFYSHYVVLKYKSSRHWPIFATGAFM